MPQRTTKWVPPQRPQCEGIATQVPWTLERNLRWARPQWGVGREPWLIAPPHGPAVVRYESPAAAKAGSVGVAVVAVAVAVVAAANEGDPVRHVVRHPVVAAAAAAVVAAVAVVAVAGAVVAAAVDAALQPAPSHLEWRVTASPGAASPAAVPSHAAPLHPTPQAARHQAQACDRAGGHCCHAHRVGGADLPPSVSRVRHQTRRAHHEGPSQRAKLHTHTHPACPPRTVLATKHEHRRHTRMKSLVRRTRTRTRTQCRRTRSAHCKVNVRNVTHRIAHYDPFVYFTTDIMARQLRHASPLCAASISDCSSVPMAAAPSGWFASGAGATGGADGGTPTTVSEGCAAWSCVDDASGTGMWPTPPP